MDCCCFEWDFGCLYYEMAEGISGVKLMVD